MVTKLPRLLMPRAEAEALLQNQIHRGDAARNHELNDESIAEAIKRVDAWEKQTRELLLEMFDSQEIADEFTRAVGLGGRSGNPLMEKLYHTGTRVNEKIRMLRELIERLSLYGVAIQEKKEFDFWTLIHPAIVGVAKSRFDSGHYADCAEAALKHINTVVKAKVKRKTGQELDGAALMNKAFSVNNPIITIDDISTQSGKDIQQGYMQIFAGAMIGIRNPKAHDVIVIDRERAIHFIFLASLLMHTLDMAG